jgi:hypothetical protein
MIQGNNSSSIKQDELPKIEAKNSFIITVENVKKLFSVLLSFPKNDRSPELKKK